MRADVRVVLRQLCARNGTAEEVGNVCNVRQNLSKNLSKRGVREPAAVLIGHGWRHVGCRSL